MSLSPFTLVRTRRRDAKAVAPLLAEPLEGPRAKLGSKLLASLAGEEKAQDEVVRLSPEVSTTVGIWDLGAWVGEMPEILATMNGAQQQLRFFEVHAAIPAGLTSTKQRVIKWGEARLGTELSPRNKREITNSIIDEEFFELAKLVRRDLGVDYLIALSPDAIAGEETDQDGHTVHSDFFSSSLGKTSLVSTVRLREYAEKADRTFAFAVGFIITSVIFYALNSRVEYHKEERGCLMDYNYVRAHIARAMAKPFICDECARKSKPQFLAIARSLLEGLDQMPRTSAALETA
jgi:hypothetical protein